MRILVVLVCSLALATIVVGAQKEQKKSQPKKQAQTAQHATQTTGNRPGGGGTGNKRMPTSTGQKARTGQSATATHQGQKGKKSQTSNAAYNGQNTNKHQNLNTANQRQKAKNNQSANQVRKGKAAARNGDVTRETKPTNGATGEQTGNKAKTAQGKRAQTKTAQNKPLKPQHFNLAKQPNRSKAPAVKFQQGRRIAGSQNWQGQKYTVFRNYKSEWHDQNWWRGHYGNNFTFVFGAPYYWRSGYWFPAWGYNPNAYYAWDGPIYGYNRLPPDQVIANAQAVLQQQGYYRGDVDGLIGPLTRGAIADYQRDHGLYMTSTIDQPTLQSLGIG